MKIVKNIVLFCVAVSSVVLGGYAFSFAWELFVYPFGIDKIGVAHACGIMALINYIKSDKVDDQEYEKTILIAFFKPLFMIVACYIFKLFM